jgi:hypothetical protein
MASPCACVDLSPLVFVHMPHNTNYFSYLASNCLMKSSQWIILDTISFLIVGKQITVVYFKWCLSQGRGFTDFLVNIWLPGMTNFPVASITRTPSISYTTIITLLYQIVKKTPTQFSFAWNKPYKMNMALRQNDWQLRKHQSFKHPIQSKLKKPITSNQMLWELVQKCTPGRNLKSRSLGMLSKAIGRKEGRK